MSSPAKRKGDAAERAVVAALQAAGFPYAERRPAGAPVDLGDVTGLALPLVIEVRNRKEQRLGEWAAEAATKAQHFDKPGIEPGIGVTWAKRPGRVDAADWTVAMTGRTFLTLLSSWAGPGLERPPRHRR